MNMEVEENTEEQFEETLDRVAGEVALEVFGQETGEAKEYLASIGFQLRENLAEADRDKIYSPHDPAKLHEDLYMIALMSEDQREPMRALREFDNITARELNTVAANRSRHVSVGRLAERYDEYRKTYGAHPKVPEITKMALKINMPPIDIFGVPSLDKRWENALARAWKEPASPVARQSIKMGQIARESMIES